jgi:hypothetical protein
MLKTPHIQQVSNYVLCFFLWIQVRLDLPVNLPNWLIFGTIEEIDPNLFHSIQFFFAFKHIERLSFTTYLVKVKRLLIDPCRLVIKSCEL